MTEPMEIERKYLVRPPVARQKLGTCRVVDIEQFYLAPTRSGEKLRYRKRVEDRIAQYFRTAKRPAHHPAVRYEDESLISAEEYEKGKQRMVPGSHLVRKQRLVFIYDGQEFELDEFIEPRLEQHILEIELDSEHEDVRLPPFLTIDKEVTGDKAYSNYALALR